MKLILVEFPWQAIKISENKDFHNYIIVSTDPEASYILKKNKLKYFETEEFCNHDALWSKYKDITENSLQITKILDKYLWKFDNRFKNLQWNFFNDFHYMFKISYDQLYYYIELISNLIQKYNPSEIIVADTENIKFDKQILIDSNVSLFKFLFQNLIEDREKIKIKYLSKNSGKIDKKLSKRKLILEKLKNIYFKLNFYFRYFSTNPEYLSIGSFEINKFKKLYPQESKKYISYNHETIKYDKSKKNWDHLNEFLETLKKDDEFNSLMNYKKIRLNDLFFQIILLLTKSFDDFIKEYYKSKKIVNKIKPKCLIFQTMTPFYSPNVIFRKICKDLKLPYATWVHGGYSGYSLHGWDVSDYRFCTNHISYGIHLDEIINNKKSILNKLNLQKNHKVFPIGSPRFDFFLREKKKNKKLKKNSKSTILYSVGCYEPRNQFYFGYNRKKNFSQLWEFHYQVIKLLKKYEDQFNIIVKDLPNASDLWKNVLKDIDAKNISYISNEFSFTDLLKISDLNLFSVLSTTFFESLYFDADIFFIEDKDEIDSNIRENKLKNELFYFSDTDQYIKELDAYLNEGKFYKTKKDNSKNYFLNLKNFQKRDKLLNQALSQIVQKT